MTQEFNVMYAIDKLTGALYNHENPNAILPASYKIIGKELYDILVSKNDIKENLSIANFGSFTPIELEIIKYKDQARGFLKSTDKVAIRCFKADIKFPSDWKAYTVALEEIINNPSPNITAPLPTKPPIPAGI